LVLKTGGYFNFDDYRSPVGGQGALTSTNRRSNFGPAGELAWTFFPRTAVVVTGEYSLFNWNNNVLDGSGESGGLGDYVIIPNSEHLKVEAGLRGRLTERLVVVAMAGYGDAKYDEEKVSVDGAEGDAEAVGFGADTKGVERLLVSAQARYRIGANQNFSASYVKNFTDVFFTNYAAFHDIGVNWDGKFGERLSAMATTRVRMENYNGEVQRQDQVLRAGVGFGLKVADWTSLSLSSSFLQRFSSLDSANYADLNTQLSVTVAY
jgi:hypothetical protein